MSVSLFVVFIFCSVFKTWQRSYFFLHLLFFCQQNRLFNKTLLMRGSYWIENQGIGEVDLSSFYSYISCKRCIWENRRLHFYAIGLTKYYVVPIDVRVWPVRKFIRLIWFAIRPRTKKLFGRIIHSIGCFDGVARGRGTTSKQLGVMDRSRIS